MALVAGHEVPDEERSGSEPFQQGAAVAVVEGPPVVVGHRGGGGREAAGGGDEEGRLQLVVEEAEDGRRPPVELAEAAEEAGAVDEAAPVLADEGCAEEVDGLWQEAQEDLQEQVVRGKREMERRRRRGGAVAGELLHGFGKWGIGCRGVILI